MNYFDTLPKILHNDVNGNSVLVNNILTRAYVLPKLSSNIQLFYKYDIKQDDTPDNLSYRYYNDVNRYWLILYANNIIDPSEQWPVDDNILEECLIKKYRSFAAEILEIPVSEVTDSQVSAVIRQQIHHYEKKVSTVNSIDNMVMDATVQIDQSSYQLLQEGSQTATFTDGTKVTKTTTKRAVSFYVYEQEKNEEKRTINLIKDIYANECERELKSLMSQ